MNNRKHLTAGEVKKLLAAVKGSRNEARPYHVHYHSVRSYPKAMADCLTANPPYEFRPFPQHLIEL